SNETRHRSDGVLHGNVRIHAMLIIEVDRLDPEPLQACLAGLPHVLGTAVHPVRLPLTAHLAELAGQEHALAEALDRAPDQLLVVAPAVHIRAVEMVDADFYRMTDQCLRLAVFSGTINARHRHAAKADGRDGGAALAKPAIDDRHCASPARWLTCGRGREQP